MRPRLQPQLRRPSEDAFGDPGPERPPLEDPDGSEEEEAEAPRAAPPGAGAEPPRPLPAPAATARSATSTSPSFAASGPRCSTSSRRSRHALAATFEGARPVSCGPDGLEIGFPPDQPFNKRKAEIPERRDAVAAALAAVLGRELRPAYVVLDEGEAPPDTPAPGSEEIDEDAILEQTEERVRRGGGRLVAKVEVPGASM